MLLFYHARLVTVEDDVKQSEVETPTKRASKRHLPRWLVWLLLILCGALLMVAFRYVTIKDTSVHYHANFALYANGQQDQFQGPGYYEEVTACNAHNHEDLASRTHMHDNVNHVIHVHDHSVTWSDFFANLGYTLGDTVLVTEKGTYVDGQDGNKLTFLLNGKSVSKIANTIIKSEDVLLINYGKDDSNNLQSRYNAIPKDAHRYNVTKDPAACQGGEGLTPLNRLKQAIGFTTH